MTKAVGVQDRAKTSPSRQPQRLWLIPSRLFLLVYRPRTTTAALRERFGDMAAWDFHGQRFFMALTPEAARQVLVADPDGYEAFWKESFRNLVGPGSLWVLDGERHHHERQVLGPAFHARGFAGYGETIRSITRQELAHWQPGQTLRVLDATLAISLQVIMRVVFGVSEASAMREGHRVLLNLLKGNVPLIVFFPGLQRPWFPLWRRHLRAQAEASAWAGRQIEMRRAQSQESDDVLGRMLAARYEDGSPMRDKDICDELFTILLAGHETTATALAWALYELARHPSALEKLRVELATLGPNPDPLAIVKLPYLSAVCNETLRHHTLLAEVARVAAVPQPLCGYSLLPGDSALVSIMAIHHDPALYPDPDAFIPERFIDHTYTPLEFLPFGGGNRRCLGSALSDFEMRIALAEIVTHWDLQPAAVERDIRHDIAMGPKNGVRMRIKAQWSPKILSLSTGAQA